MTKIESAGYIVHDNEAIWGYGATEDIAWASFQTEMQHGGVEVVDEPTEDQLDNAGDWTRKSSYQVRAASAALLARVEDVGGNIAWRVRNGVACTVAEDEAESAAP